MDTLDGLIQGFGVILTPGNLYYCFIGSLIGTLTGVLPGIGPLAALSLLLPATYGLSPVESIAMLSAIFYGAMYGGSITSILVNIPGEAASVVTCLDGYQMARKGRAGVALGISAIGSFLAGTVSLVILTYLSPTLAEFAVRLGPPEYTVLVLLGLICTLMMIHGSLIKGVVMLALGALLAAVGTDVVTGTERFAFGSVNFAAGFDLVSVVIGLFGVSEILSNIEETLHSQVVTRRISNLWPNRADWRASWAPMLRGTGLGFGLGLVPGGSPVTASFLSYAIERRVADKPEEFGTGRIEGVAGPEAANNAAVAGGMIPLLSLGIPGNPVTALLMGALIIQGVQPGPMFLSQHPDVFWGVIASMYVGNVILLILNLPLVGLWVQLLRVPYQVLFPIILLLAMVGSYSSNKNMFDLWVMLGFGVFGYVARKFRYELSPLVLGLVLAPMFEQSLRQAMVMSPDGLMIFINRPMSLAVLVLIAAIVVYSIISRNKGRTINEKLA